MDMSLSKLQELVMDNEACMLQFMGLERVGHNWVTEVNWTDVWKKRREESHPKDFLFLLYLCNYSLNKSWESGKVTHFTSNGLNILYGPC